MKWKTISSAPTDGIYILLYDRKDREVLHGRFVNGKWCDAWQDDPFICCDFTHWMPMPEPPKENQ